MKTLLLFAFGIFSFQLSIGQSFTAAITAGRPTAFCPGGSVVLSANAGDGKWTKKADFEGGAQQGAEGLSIGNKGYLGTGLNKYGTFNKFFWEDDPASNLWTQKADNDFWEFDPGENTCLWLSGGTTPSITAITPGSYTVTVTNSEGYSATSEPIAGEIANCNNFYSKPIGDLHNRSTWGTNPDGSGTNPPDFGADKTFHLANRSVGNFSKYNMTGDWTVAGKIAMQTYPANGIPSGLSLNAFKLSVGEIIDDGTEALSGVLNSDKNASLVITGSSSPNINLRFSGYAPDTKAELKDLTINLPNSTDNVILQNPVDLYGTLTVTNGHLKGEYSLYNPTVSLTLKSNENGTARVATMDILKASIDTRVTVERYIPARRAWRLLSAPITDIYLPWQTINQAWQEGATSAKANPAPGYGTHITGNSSANGFDINPISGASPSILRYHPATDRWLGLENTNATLVAITPYFLFVRGDRSIDLGYNNVSPRPTTLRSSGMLRSGNQIYTAPGGSFGAIPNPFASPINFATITRQRIADYFFVWDPKLGGPNGVGGYVAMVGNGSGGYNAYPAPASPISQYIQSGQAFLVHTTGSDPGNLVIKETDKAALPPENVFRSAALPTGLRTTLLTADKNGINAVIDETFTAYSAKYSNEVNELDVVKPNNLAENLGSLRSGQILMVERRASFAGSDTIFLQLKNTEKKEYVLQFTPDNLTATNIQSGVLIDDYLRTTNPIDLTTLVNYKFTIDGNAASANPQRFMVVLSKEKLTDALATGAGTFRVIPNPISGRTIQLQFISQPKGTYNIQLVNSLGQVIYKNQVQHPDGNELVEIILKNNIAKGVYQLHVSNLKSSFKTAIPVISN